MEIRQIIFPAINEAALITVREELGPNDVCVKTVYSTVSCGTERANITGDPNVDGRANTVVFPRSSGYSSAGRVTAVGSQVTDLRPGDRVVVYWGKHKDYNIVPRSQVVPIPDDRIDWQEAALSFVATFPLAAIRKTRLELGESVLIMGLGLLGQLAVQLAHAGGGYPIIAVDPVAERRAMALRFGADYALDPTEPDFPEQVRSLTGGGANVCIEVTGLGKGLEQALDCMAKYGRVALLGCTRNKEFTIDYYRKVHFPGISLIGAHTMARPDEESSPGRFTHRDDILSVLRLTLGGRLHLREMIARTYAPEDCAACYHSLITDPAFGPVVQFCWQEEVYWQGEV